MSDRLTAVLLFALLGLSASVNAVDVRIINGHVIDGSEHGGPPNRIVDIVGDRIVYVGPTRKMPHAKRVIDARSFIVSPGFIDPHTHAEVDLFHPERASNLPYLFQGVSTVFVGNDGGGGDVTESRQQLEALRPGTNVGLFSGHGDVRRRVMGFADRAPSEDELERMKALVRKDMESGALGLSTGLFYAPGSYASTEEVIAIAQVASEFGGIYESHLRDESDYSIGLIGAVEEALQVGEKAEIPVHISHIKALGPAVQGASGELVKMIERANADGMRVTADQYPWVASGTRLSNALVPRSLMSGGLEELHRLLIESFEMVRQGMVGNLARRGGAEALLITGVSPYQGMTLAEAAETSGEDVLRTAANIIIAGDPSVASFMMSPDDVERLMVQPWVLTSSDGSNGHPRKYTTFPKKFRSFVFEKALLSTQEFVHQSTGLTASTFGLCNRGQLKAGMMADVAIWSPLGYSPNATYEQPEVLASGVSHLIVNGEFAIDDGQRTKQRPGRVLSRDCAE